MSHLTLLAWWALLGILNVALGYAAARCLLLQSSPLPPVAFAAPRHLLSVREKLLAWRLLQFAWPRLGQRPHAEKSVLANEGVPVVDSPTNYSPASRSPPASEVLPPAEPQREEGPYLIPHEAIAYATESVEALIAVPSAPATRFAAALADWHSLAEAYAVLAKGDTANAGEAEVRQLSEHYARCRAALFAELEGTHDAHEEHAMLAGALELALAPIDEGLAGELPAGEVAQWGKQFAEVCRRVGAQLAAADRPSSAA